MAVTTNTSASVEVVKSVALGSTVDCELRLFDIHLNTLNSEVKT